VSHLSAGQRVAAGLHLPDSSCQPFAATQGAWRFYANENLSLDQLAGPPVQCARAGAAGACDAYVLVVYDWCNLHYTRHGSKGDRVELAHGKDLGYELLTALAVSDRDGAPLAPLCLELRAADGVHSTRSGVTLRARSSLDAVGPVMLHVAGLDLGRTPVSVIDREGDSVGHYRRWHAQGHKFLVRGDDNRNVLHEGRERKLGQVASLLKRRGELLDTRAVEFKGKPARQFVGETAVVLHRPARRHRVNKRTGRARHKLVPGVPLAMRLVVSEVRDAAGKVLARWLLLTNLGAEVSAATAALWYYWRWRIEGYHKLLKGAGQQVEGWQQETAAALARRLVVAAMACVVVWNLARDDRPRAAEMRDVLVRLSRRQIKRGKRPDGKPARGFTEPALLAGMGVLIPMLDLLETHDLAELRALAATVLPVLEQRSRPAPGRESG
jgi:hypothetical protein